MTGVCSISKLCCVRNAAADN